MRAFREECSLSQSELSSALGISRNYVSMLELGRKEPSAQLRKAFEAYADSQLRRKRLMSEIVEQEDALVRQNLRDESPSDMQLHPASTYSRRTTAGIHRIGTPPVTIASKLNEEELLKSIEMSTQKIRGETNPVMRLGYLNTIRTVLDDLERRLSEDQK